MSIIKTHDITLYGGNIEFDIVLKPLCDEHLPLLYKWCADPEILYWTEGGTDDPYLSYDHDTVHDIYGGVSQNAFCFLVEANGFPIGECWLQKMNLPNVIAMYPSGTDVRRIDMSIGEKEYWNKGIGTMMIHVLIDFAFTNENIDVLHCFCEDYNIRSCRVWEKSGLELVFTEELPQPQKGKLQFHWRVRKQKYLANNIISYLNTLPQVKSCNIYGSLINGNADKYSDIDIVVDVSGSDNGMFMKALPELIGKRFPVIWHDFALSLAPEQYVVSVAIDENNPFCVVDFKCTATPHIETVQKSDLENDIYFHLTKLWVANCKHYIRGADCTSDIQKMARCTISAQSEKMSNEQILEEILHRLENSTTPETTVYVANCRKAWKER